MDHSSIPLGKPKTAGILSPLRITLIYLVAGFGWFLITDELFGRLFSIPINLLLARGAIFILVTGTLLYFLARVYRSELSRFNGELQEASERARIYFQSAVEGILSVDDKGVIVGSNPTAETLFGYALGELIGKSIEVLIPERLRQTHRQHRATYFQAPRSRPMGLGLDLVGRRKDGREFPIEVSLSFVETSKGRLVITFITDITERLALEREARRGQTMTTLGMVAAGIVHEINNPIGIISSRAELLLADADSQGLPADLRSDLEVLHRNALRVGRISQGLLALARQEPKASGAVSLNDVIENALLLISKQINKDGMQIETTLQQSLPSVSGNATALEEVIINLVMNAREAMPDGGLIRIETSDAIRPGWVRVAVSDQGKGIVPADIPRLFDPFFSTKTTGVGMGLWLSKRIIRDHHGDIQVQSEIGKGTQFLIDLPSVPGSVPQSAAPEMHKGGGEMVSE